MEMAKNFKELSLPLMKMRMKNEKTVEKKEEELVSSEFFLGESSSKEKELQMRRN